VSGGEQAASTAIAGKRALEQTLSLGQLHACVALDMACVLAEPKCELGAALFKLSFK